MAEKKEELTVYECLYCYQILPYRSCYHNCPGLDDWERDEDTDDGFKENLGGFYQEIKQAKKNGVEITVIGADDQECLLEDAVVLAVPDQPGKVYKESITGHDLDGSYHILRQHEELPEGVEPIRMVEVTPGKYRKMTDMESVEMDTSMARVNLEDEEEHPRFKDLFEEFREPYP